VSRVEQQASQSLAQENGVKLQAGKGEPHDAEDAGAGHAPK
jgi:hypothetical protein